jgi:hypothetical protein
LLDAKATVKHLTLKSKMHMAQVLLERAKGVAKV